LVVDDNPAKRLAIRAVLAPLGYHIVEADSGVIGLRCVTSQDFAVILLDVRMPVMDGFETAALIRMRKESELTPIIFITAQASDEIVTTNRYAQGAVDFITAPIQPDELRAKVSFFAGQFLKAETLASQAREVQASADHLRLLTEAAPIGIFQTDAENRYVYTNPRWSQITGLSSDEALGQRWDVIIADEHRSQGSPNISDEPATETEFSQRFEIAVPGQASRMVLVTSRSIQDSSGTTSGWLGTLADITAVAEAEAAMADARDQATEASRLKSDFLANMSHEIRTPMNGVIGMTDLLLETDLDVVQRDYALTVRNSGEALLTVINDILDFSKIETGKLEIEEIEFNVETVLHDVTNILNVSAHTKGLDLAAVIEESVPARVSGDPGRVRQVLTNLIGNAIKFTHNGGVAIRVTAAEEARSKTVLLFEVSDTGVGIAPDKLTMIFEPFSQADTTTSRRFGGTGLGLAISGQLVALMGGDVGVQSQPGTGSTFWFTVSVHARVEEAPPSGPARTGTTHAGADSGPDVHVPGDSEPGTLLLAEDNPINQKVAVLMLAGAGYLVDTVSTGRQAVVAADARAYDAILMDCQMPDLNGYEATAAIRAQEGAARHTPIIALTAGARHEDRDRCLAEGMDFYLSKPFNKDTLLDVVRQSLKSEPNPGLRAPSGAEIVAV
jgi:PAS domain S-box-containing protein